MKTQTPETDFIRPDVLEPKQNWFNSWFPYLRWVPSSPTQLKEAEENLVNYIQTPSEGFYVYVGTVNGHDCNIWTRKFKGKSNNKKEPLVMMHGMGAGLAMFAMNIDNLCEDTDVYAIDLPGFGRSARPDFSSDPVEAEKQYITCIEAWRQNLNLGKINLLGHSFGGYLTASYALTHPENLEKAILADPWGMKERPTDIVQRYNIPIWVRAVFSVVKHFNPLAGFRISGPAGPGLVKRIRPDLMNKYKGLIEEEKLHVVSEYLFHCNAHKPSGESAFHSMMKEMAWARSPMLPRLKDRDHKVPLTVMFGANSWITSIPQEEFQESSVENVEVHLISNAGHHIYADQHEQFNQILRNTLMKRK
ncbi:1-acylglycerol-3-phosphate O-acyltransferase ABHD5 [Eurytemora carolleeae]|uniref:1-acylglycerol-3-phosphate O-acyltransferase ABHD5 n=1 Tax=Eurytemora carolleeae TaxID=1294199 RepID=UPI000C76255E|nr:1-acylglycerol-3-phosphate O-acyltransferase ABHD5 [Eurytemora carolleeae]|eukprot:XP_023335546.1 1-acylglycerol-3-phosphate O-acyltransferase ABHD5-like [Eurytemora affinis]